MGGNHDLRLWEMGRNNPLLLFSPSVTVPKFERIFICEILKKYSSIGKCFLILFTELKVGTILQSSNYNSGTVPNVGARWFSG